MRIDKVLEEDIFPFLPEAWGRAIRHADTASDETVNEVRLRVGQPICLRYGLREVIVPSTHIVSARQIADIVSSLCHHSRYAMESELKNGYITIRGGHRIGLAGQAVVADGRVKLIGQIHSLAIRVAREAVGCAESVLPHLWKHGRVRSTLIVAPPYCGKTTILRDLIRLVSNGDAASGRQGLTVGVADERSEITGAYQGIPTLAVGARTDVIVGAPKGAAVMTLLRAMSPAVIAMDELGGADDIAAAEEAAHMGVGVIATLHGRSWRDITRRLDKTREEIFDLFECIVFLDDHPTIGSIRCVEKREDAERRQDGSDGGDSDGPGGRCRYRDRSGKGAVCKTTAHPCAHTGIVCSGSTDRICADTAGRRTQTMYGGMR